MEAMAAKRPPIALSPDGSTAPWALPAQRAQVLDLAPTWGQRVTPRRPRADPFARRRCGFWCHPSQQGYGVPWDHGCTASTGTQHSEASDGTTLKTPRKSCSSMSSRIVRNRSTGITAPPSI